LFITNGSQDAVRDLDFAQKKKQKLAGKYSANHIHTSFVLQPTIRRVNIENASQCRGANGQTLLGHVTRRALIIHLLAGKGQRARGQCPATWNSLPGLAYCGGGVDGWSNRHSNNPRQQRPRGLRWNKCKKRCSMSSALHLSHGSLCRRYPNPARRRCYIFCSPNAGNCVALLQSLCT